MQCPDPQLQQALLTRLTERVLTEASELLSQQSKVQPLTDQAALKKTRYAGP